MIQEQVSDPTVAGFNTPSNKTPGPLKKGLIKIGVFALSAAVVVPVAVNWWHEVNAVEETDNAFVAAHIHQISSRVAGTVRSVRVDEHNRVKTGQELLSLDGSDYQTAVAEAQAQLNKARAESKSSLKRIDQLAASSSGSALEADAIQESATAVIAEAEAAVRSATAAIAIAQQTLKQRQAELDKAESDFGRFEVLTKQGATSQQQFDSTRKDRDVAKAALASAQVNLLQTRSMEEEKRQALNAMHSRLLNAQSSALKSKAESIDAGSSRDQYAGSKAAVAAATAALQQAKLNLSYTRISAPVAGHIGRRAVETGQRILPGQPVFGIVSEDRWITANFKETQLRRIKVGQPVKIIIDATPDRFFDGYVDSVAPATGSQFALLPADNATGNFTKVVQRIPVKIRFRDKELKGISTKLAPGMSAIVRVRVTS